MHRARLFDESCSLHSPKVSRMRFAVGLLHPAMLIDFETIDEDIPGHQQGPDLAPGESRRVDVEVRHPARQTAAEGSFGSRGGTSVGGHESRIETGSQGQIETGHVGPRSDAQRKPGERRRLRGHAGVAAGSDAAMYMRRRVTEYKTRERDIDAQLV